MTIQLSREVSTVMDMDSVNSGRKAMAGGGCVKFQLLFQERLWGDRMGWGTWSGWGECMCFRGWGGWGGCETTQWYDTGFDFGGGNGEV